MKFNELLEFKPKEEINYTDLLSCDEWIIKSNEIKKRDLDKCTRCKTKKSIGAFYSGNNLMFLTDVNGKLKSKKEKIHLEVHHLFYIIGYLPWDYQDKDLVTVCNICHKIIHKNEEIVVYDKLKKINTKNCSRCSGSGFLQQYTHVENGICFKCRGTGTPIPLF